MFEDIYVPYFFHSAVTFDWHFGGIWMSSLETITQLWRHCCTDFLLLEICCSKVRPTVIPNPLIGDTFALLWKLLASSLSMPGALKFHSDVPWCWLVCWVHSESFQSEDSHSSVLSIYMTFLISPHLCLSQLDSGHAGSILWFSYHFSPALYVLFFCSIFKDIPSTLTSNLLIVFNFCCHIFNF